MSPLITRPKWILIDLPVRHLSCALAVPRAIYSMAAESRTALYPRSGRRALLSLEKAEDQTGGRRVRQ
jgi:hypothetical protein